MINPENIKDLISDIETQAADTEERLKELKTSARRLYYATHEYNSENVKKAPYIVKKVIYYMARGETLNNAVALTAADFNTSLERVHYIINAQKVHTAALNLYAKKFFVVTLKKSGYSIKDIAALLRISEAHAYRLARAKCFYSELVA